MSFEQLFSVAASAAFLGLAGIAVVRGANNPLALPLALLCVDMFAYNGLEVLGDVTRASSWEWPESAAAAIAAPLLLHLTLGFLGARRDQRPVLIASYVYFGAVALSCFAPFADPALAHYPGGRGAVAMLVGLAPLFVWVAAMLVRHFRASGTSEERARTQLFIGTIVLGVGGPLLDLSAIAGRRDTPPLAAVGLLISSILLTALALRSRLLEGTRVLLAVNAVLIGIVGVAAHLFVFTAAGGATAFLVLGTIAVTLGSLGAARTLWAAWNTARERTAHLATLGRLSSQMAHDIRNPLAAIRGAAQYLEQEKLRGGSLAEHGEFLDLIVEQADRLERVVRDYQRLGRAEPVRARLEVRELAAKVIDGARRSALATDGGATLVLDVEPIEASLDPDLVTAALENLVRNALEAFERDGGTVRIVGAVRSDRGRRMLALSVEDDGPGMDARTRERAEDAFFTTKTTGSGLGLAFVRKVAEAHGGQLHLQSAQGRGTRVTIELPIA